MEGIQESNVCAVMTINLAGKPAGAKSIISATSSGKLGVRVIDMLYCNKTGDSNVFKSALPYTTSCA
jgi:hypothetical protein